MLYRTSKYNSLREAIADYSHGLQKWEHHQGEVRVTTVTLPSIRAWLNVNAFIFTEVNLRVSVHRLVKAGVLEQTEKPGVYRVR